jgi:hypothetical protein
MNALVTYFKKDDKGNQEYDLDRRPVTATREMHFPLRFGFGSYNEPRKLFGTWSVDAEDVISVDVMGVCTNPSLPVDKKCDTLCAGCFHLKIQQ